jgi:RNA polymerase subunit RPABC4/transcription elongation factor Spt4
MDNSTATACKKCHAIIFYDQDASEPELCPVCEKKERERQIDLDDLLHN